MDLGMKCTCREDGVLEAEARRLRVAERLGVTAMADLVTTVLHSLAWDFGCTSADVRADMWFGVSVDTGLLAESLFVQCDNVADGLLAAWEHLAELAPERVSRNSSYRTDDHGEVARRVSAVLVRQYQEVERAYRAHRKAAHRDGNDCPPCIDCEVGMSLRASAMVALDQAWGERVLDPAIETAWD